MSISNYIPSSRCGYKYDKLKNVVYLVTKDHLKDIHIDNGDAYIINLDEAPMKVECTSVEFNEQESLDERYKFTKTLKFTVNGYANVNSLEGGCYGIIVAADGTTYMTNVDFPAKVTFTYNLTSTKNQTEFTFSSQSNYPTLRLDASLEPSARSCKVYADYGVESISFVEKDYVTLNDRSSVITLYGGRQFRTVEFNKNACTLQETWDGEKAVDTLSFDICFDGYQTSWQYNLLEFMDNLYAGMVKPKSDSNAFFLGFNFGLRPSYEIITTTSEGESNKITITMREDSVHGMYTLDNPRIVEDGTVTWRYVESVGDIATYECIDYNIAMYLAMEEIDIHNNPTGRYKVLSGYETRYEELFNVVGTFDDVVTFYTTKCSWFNPCKIIGNMPSMITFTGTQCKEFTFGSRCDWHLENIPSYLLFNRTSGSANVEYTVQICNTLVTDNTVTTSFDVVHGNRRDAIGVTIMSGNMKLIARYQNSSTYALACDGTGSTLAEYEVKVSTIAPYSTMIEAIIGLCVETIGSGAFSYLSNLGTVLMSDSVKTIWDGAFYNDVALQSISLSNNLQYLGTNAFYGCTNLRSITIPNSVTYMGNYTFGYCTNLASVSLSTGMTAVPTGTFSDCYSLSSVTIPSTYLYVGQYGFKNCTGLTSVNVGGVVRYEDEAFQNCISLTGITFLQNTEYIGYKAFQYCTGLTTVTIPSGVTYVGGYSFEGCSGLTAIYLEPLTPPQMGNEDAFLDTNNCPMYVHCESLYAYQTSENWRKYAKRYVPMESNCPVKFEGHYMNGSVFKLACDGSSALTASEVNIGGSNGELTSAIVGSCDNTVVTIGAGAFGYETYLTGVTLPNSITAINDQAFMKCTSLPNLNFIPNGVTKIGSYTFSECTSIPSVAFPSSLTTIGSFTFNSCTSLTGITWGSSMTYVGSYDFYNCSSLPSVNFNSTNITTLNSGCFESCTSLTSITLDNSSVTTISGNAFSNCTSLPTVTIPNRVTYLGPGVFAGCTGLKSATLGSGIDTLNQYVFDGCSSLSSVTMTNNVTGIYDYAFRNCTSLSSITLSNSLTTIGNYVWYNDSQLRSITIPSGVTSMGSELLANCTSLEGIYMRPHTPPTLGSNAFGNTNNCLIYVPCCVLGDYQTASQWSNYKDRIVGYDYNDDCGTCPVKLALQYNDQSSVIEYCDSESGITSANTRGSIVGGKSHTNIVNATIGDCVNAISAETFSGCSSMSAVTFPTDSVVRIGNNAFISTGLRSISIPNSVTEIGNYALAYNYSLAGITLPTGLTYINYALCYGDTSLTGITIPNRVTSIYAYAFGYCSNMNNVTLPEACTSIGNSAFVNCSNLDYIEIPGAVTSIGSGAFSGCTDMQYARIESLTPPSLGSSAFTNVGANENYPIYVHCCALGAYQRNSEWGKYKSRLRSIESSCEPKIEATFNGGTQYSATTKLYCSGCSVSHTEQVTQTEIRDILPNLTEGDVTYSAMTDVKISGCTTQIGANAFSYCIGLEHVTMSDDITVINANGFVGCNAMSSITLSNSLVEIGQNAFLNCTSLTGITLPNTLQTISGSAFEHCASIEGAITIPSGVTNIGSMAFRDCHHITSINIPSGVTYLWDTFENDIKLRSVSLPDGLTSIGDYTFRLCKELSAITIPNTVTYIGAKAFEQCESLTTLTIPSGVTEIGDDAFLNCSGITSVTVEAQRPPVLDNESVFDNLGLANGWTMYVPCYESYSTADKWSEYAGHMIEYGGGCQYAVVANYSDSSQYVLMCADLTNGELAKSNMQSGPASMSLLTDISISGCVTSIGTQGLQNCYSLSSCTMSNRLTSIGTYAFQNCRSLTTISIPTGVTGISQSVFSNCSGLTSVTIPSSVTLIGGNAFYNCNHLPSIDIPNSVTTISTYAFDNCTGMTSCTIGNGIRSIGNYAFRSCSGLTGVTITATTPPSISSATFYRTNNCPIYVPSGSVSTYQSQWGNYVSSSRIQAIT